MSGQHVPARGAGVWDHHHHARQARPDHGGCRGKKPAQLLDEARVDAVEKEHGAQSGLRHCVRNEGAVYKGRSPPDLKAANVLLDRDLHAKVCDFGLSKTSMLQSASASASGGGVVGTPAWDSLEELRIW